MSACIWSRSLGTYVMGFHPYEDWESKIVKTVIEFSTTIRLTDNDANSS
ncbi:MAG TPA: hypothetical protein VGL74_09105 [Terriglobales bacterium]